MTPEAAKQYAQDLLNVHAQVNSSYVANGSVAKAAEIATVVLDQATQLEAAQAELVTLKRQGQARVAKPREVVRPTGD